MKSRPIGSKASLNHDLSATAAKAASMHEDKVIRLKKKLKKSSSSS